MVPFVAQGMSLLETSSFIRGGLESKGPICSAGYVSARDF